jgi:hypothetical protein
VGSTGTQSEEETGRGVGVAGIPSGPRYPIGVFEKEGFGTTYCGALIRDKMCVRSTCTVQSHKTKKVKDLFPLTGDEEQVVMIYSGPVADRKASVSLIPRLSPSMFGDKLSECLVLSKAHESWLMVFEAMAKTNSNVGARDPEDDVNVTEVLRMTEMPVSFAMSPRALPKPTESKSRSSPENVGISRMQVPWSLVGSQDEVVTVLRGSWPLLVDHVHELKDVVTAIQESIRANRNEVAAEFNQLDYKIATIKALALPEINMFASSIIKSGAIPNAFVVEANRRINSFVFSSSDLVSQQKTEAMSLPSFPRLLCRSVSASFVETFLR